jgi:MFS transporter, ACS family, tartrate transporter
MVTSKLTSRGSAPALGEPQVYRKVRRRIIPLIFVGYLLCYMDRTIVGVAALQMNESIGLSAAAYGAGAGLFFLTYLLFEPPSNVILARVGARIWLTRIMVTWGLVTAATAFIQGETSFYIMRLLLGAAEAGYFPGAIFYIAMWFPPHLRAKPIALMVLGLPVGVVLGAPLGGWILSWGGVFEGWQWLFLIVGTLTMLYGIVLFRWLPSNPDQARWLTDGERSTIIANASFDRPHRPFREQMAGFRVFFTRPALWVMTVVYFVICVVSYAATFFLPLIVKQFSGLSNLQTTLVVSAAWLLSIAVVVLVARSSERFNAPWMHLVLVLLISAAGFATLVPSSSSIALFVIAATGCVSLGSAYAGAYWTAVTSLFDKPAAAAGAIALINGLAATGGYFGPQLLGLFIDATGGQWQPAAPVAAAALASAALVVAALRFALLKRKRPSEKPEKENQLA